MKKLQAIHLFDKMRIDQMEDPDGYCEHIERNSLYKMVDLIIKEGLHTKKIESHEENDSIPPTKERHEFTLFVMKLEELKRASELIKHLEDVLRNFSGSNQLQELKDLILKI